MLFGALICRHIQLALWKESSIPQLRRKPSDKEKQIYQQLEVGQTYQWSKARAVV